MHHIPTALRLLATATISSLALLTSALAQPTPTPTPTENTSKTVQTYIHQLGTFTAMLNLCNANTVQKRQFQNWLAQQETPFLLVYNIEPSQFRTWLKTAAQSVPPQPKNCDAFLSQWPAFSASLYLNRSKATSAIIDTPSQE